ncbi:hypothetical protein [Marinobacter salarius]|uniref:hypothetical protein n=1 Tax=Marinobacter TaxID=2742 RepID=UPI00241D4129|nr:hypothetical protein [Marinobacter salarius]|tara:strand:- start:10434 stop:11402 length:969 start_codon:yes stop_codon:yes gene_type:complete
MKGSSFSYKLYHLFIYGVLAIFFFFASFLLLSWYKAGDQVYYIKFYEGVRELSYFEAYAYARGVIGASDPLSIFFLWFGSFLGFSKLTYISFWNCIFLLFIVKVIRIYKVDFFLYPFIFSNFYVLVLLTGAERLKFGVFFMVCSIVFSNWLKGVFFASALVSHFQTISLVPSAFVYSMYNNLVRLFFSGKLSFYLLRYFVFLIFVFLSLVIIFWDALFGKFSDYFKEDFDGYNFINILALLFCSVLVSSNWKRIACSLAPFFFLVFLFGDSRVNILAVLFVFFAFIKEKRLSHPLSIALLVYFSFKSIFLVYNIYIYGHGFV